MSRNEKASPPVWTTGGRHAETIAAEQLVPRLHCIMDAGGIQVSRHLSRFERYQLYGAAKREFYMLQSQRRAPCQYDYFIEAIAEALWI